MKLKRIFAIFAVLIMLCSVTVLPASAASGINENEQYIYDMLFQGFDVGNVRVYFLEGREAEFTNFFNRDGVNMTLEQRDEIAKILNTAIDMRKDPRAIEWAEAGNTSLAKLPRDIKQVLLDAGTDACAVMGLTFVYSSPDNMVTITDADGVVLVHTEAVVKQTGTTDYTTIILAICASVVILSVAAFFTLKARKKSKA